MIPGDVLLYRPASVFGWVIAVKTWHRCTHVEVYAGDAQSWASRDGLGFAKYPIRLSQLGWVLRPTRPLDLAAANRWAALKVGTPYGWLELLNFVGIPLDGHGMFCSDAIVEYLRRGGWAIFPEDRTTQVAPFEFLDLVGAGFEDVTAAERV